MRIAVLVMNNVTGDSRVQKIASSALARGHEVLVIGTSDRRASGAAAVGGAPVIRVVSASRYYSREALRDLADRRRSVRDDRSDALLQHLAARSEQRRTWRLARNAVERSRALSQRFQDLREARRSAADRLLARWGARIPAMWRLGAGQLVDYENALMPLLSAYMPDVIHVNDPHPLAAAVQLREQSRDTKKVAIVYDAHEWWEGVSDGGSAFQVGLLGLERSHIRDADHVVTVTDEIATRLMDRYRLRSRPTVVRNVPRAGVLPAPGRGTVRTELGLSDDVPLLVYSGTLLQRRGVQDIVAALPDLPECHLAVICPPGHPSREELSALAAALGVGDRVHLRDFVPADSVAWYLSDATLGVSALHRSPHHDLAAPTKLAEYVHAGIPLVVSDCTTQRELVERKGVGEVFRAGDAGDLSAAVRRALGRTDELGRALAQLRAADPMDWEREFDRLVGLYGPAPEPRRRAGVALIYPSQDLLSLPWPHAPLIVQRRRGEPDMAVALTRALSLQGRALVVSDGSPTCFAGIGPAPAQALAVLRAWGVDVALIARTVADASGATDRAIPVLVTDARLLGEVAGSVWLPAVASAAAIATTPPDDRPTTVVTHSDDLDPAILESLRDLLAPKGITPRQVTVWDAEADIHVDSWVGAGGEQRVVDFLAAGAAVVVPTRSVPSVLAERPFVTSRADDVAGVVLTLFDDHERRAALRGAARAYARTTHAADAVLERLTDAAAAGPVR